MWNKIAGVLIRQRFLWLLLLGIGTLFMGSHIPNVRLQYQFGAVARDGFHRHCVRGIQIGVWN